MTRGNARELAVHLIYGRNFTGEEPNTVVETRLEKEYYNKLAEENDVYAERPSRAQRAYIDAVTAGVASREEYLDEMKERLKKGSFVRVLGSAEYDSYDHDVTFSHVEENKKTT